MKYVEINRGTSDSDAMRDVAYDEIKKILEKL